MPLPSEFGTCKTVKVRFGFRVSGFGLRVLGFGFRRSTPCPPPQMSSTEPPCASGKCKSLGPCERKQAFQKGALGTKTRILEGPLVTKAEISERGPWRRNKNIKGANEKRNFRGRKTNANVIDCASVCEREINGARPMQTKKLSQRGPWGQKQKFQSGPTQTNRAFQAPCASEKRYSWGPW